jgi:hypothetical protein
MSNIDCRSGTDHTPEPGLSQPDPLPIAGFERQLWSTGRIDAPLHPGDATAARTTKTIFRMITSSDVWPKTDRGG